MSDGRRRPSAAMVGTMRDSTVLARGRRARAAWLKPSSRLSESKMSDGRDDWIRTSDPLTPSQVRYQAAPRPEPCPGGQKGNSTTTPGRRLRLSRGGSTRRGPRPSAPRARPALRGGNRPTAPPLPVPARATAGRAPTRRPSRTRDSRTLISGVITSRSRARSSSFGGPRRGRRRHARALELAADAGEGQPFGQDEVADLQDALDVGLAVDARPALRPRHAELGELVFPRAQDVGLDLGDLAHFRCLEGGLVRDDDVLAAHARSGGRSWRSGGV